MVLALNESIQFAAEGSSLIVSITIEWRGLQNINVTNKGTILYTVYKEKMKNHA